MKQFYDYFIKFYGPKGLYPNKKGKLKLSDINKAVSVYLAKNPNREFYGDSPDREAVRDVLIKQKKLVPDYGTNEGKLNEGRSEQEYVEHYEAEIFDAIAQFKNVFQRTEWKKHRSINKIIKDLFKLEQKLSDEIGEL